MNFKTKYTIDERISESNKIMKKYPHRVPVIVEKNNNCKLDDIDKNKYLVPRDLNINQLIFIIRKRINLNSSEALFIMINNKLCPSNTCIGDIYDDNHNDDGFLYIIYTSENTFG